MRLILQFYLLALCLSATQLMAKTDRNKQLNIIFIGNSITQGVLLPNANMDAPPVKAVEYLCSHTAYSTVDYQNIGVSGSTTLDWLPITGHLFPNAIKAADAMSAKSGQMLFSIMLGTNDSAIKGPNGSPVSPEDYFKNLTVLLDTLFLRYPNAKAILHRPVWYSPNTHNGAIYLQEGLDRLISYTPQLKALVKRYKKRVFMGDETGFDYFRTHSNTLLLPEEGQSGTFYLHPNQEGAAALGRLWAEAIIKRIK